VTTPLDSAPQTDADAPWQARFRAIRISLPDWALDRPSRCLYVSNASGVFELYTWDRDTGERRQVTDRPNGTTDGAMDPDGEYVWWFDDTDGDEFGTWKRQLFDADHTAAVEAIPGLERAYSAGLDIGRNVVAVGRATDDGCELYLWRPEEEPQLVYQSAEDASIGALSTDETLLAIEHSEHGDSLHPDLRVLAGRETVAELADGPGKGLQALAFSPVRGDQRLLVQHERRGRPELLIWDPTTGSVTELDIPLDGDVSADWYPDASGLLIEREKAARTTIHRYDLSTAKLSTVETPPGVIGSATARPDGTVEYAWSNSAEPPQIRVAGRTEPLLTPPGEPAPPSVAVTDAWVDGPGGKIHALISVPAGVQGPLATVFSIHGGPHWLDSDSFNAVRAALVDAGYAVVHVNYRGSTGYGSEWRDAIIGRPGITELEDIAAVHDWAVGSGLADADRCVLEGGSWGGYLTLMGLGTQPERWAAGIAAVPVADYAAAYEDEMEQLKAFDRVLFGGSPADLPEAYEVGSPLTYVDAVKAPVLVTAGENDPRCPIRQIENYLARMVELGKPHEVYRFDAGHGSLVVTERIRQMAVELDFLRRHVPS
jgi:dipeptidyl aminopeptidase/acylaminoacyl peptidase